MTIKHIVQKKIKCAGKKIKSYNRKVMNITNYFMKN